MIKYWVNQNKKKKEKRKQTKKRENKINCLVIIDAIRQGLKKILPQIKKNSWFIQSLSQVLPNSRENDINKSFTN